MFCPKCGTQNPETGRFCRSCGADLGNVSAALAGNLPADAAYKAERKGRSHSNDPDELWSLAIKDFIMGFGFLVVAIILFVTNVAGGYAWWWAMLFPAFSLIAVGASRMAKVSRMEKKKQSGEISAAQTQQFMPDQPNAALPPTQTDYVRPQKSVYDTGELAVPPSVTEDTTRHLQMDSEGETRALPKK
jgi:hypothetical protein